MTGCGANWPPESRGGRQAAAARDPKRHKQGRIVSGAAAGNPTDQWLTPGHRLAKTVTNCVTNRWGDGPDTPGGVRERAARQDNPPLAELLARVDDKTIVVAIRGVRDLEQRWMAVPPGGTLRLCLAAGTRLLRRAGNEEPRDRPMTRASPAQNVPFGHRHPAGLGDPIPTPNGGYACAPSYVASHAM